MSDSRTVSETPSGSAAAPDGWGVRLRTYVELARPFTLVPPTLGVISGAITAFGSVSNPDPARQWTASVLWVIFLGSLCAGCLNAASNILNQYYDLEIDRKNKPGRPFPSGRMGLREGWWLSVFFYVLAVIPTWMVVTYPENGFSGKFFAPLGRHECIFIYLVGLLLTLVYSVPVFGRTKRKGFWANLTISLPRGCLLKVAGWSMVATIWRLEPWYIGFIFMIFLLGATNTKDFSDMEGDRADGCMTLPIRYGVKKAAWLTAPYLIVPWILMPLGVLLPAPGNPGQRILTGNPILLTLFGAVLAAWGGYTAYLMLRRPEELAKTENHISWTHMYLMMMFAQIGFAVAYLF
ncbi:MAG: UbiA family prenyltransferase [Acidobacteriota bacterium]